MLSFIFNVLFVDLVDSEDGIGLETAASLTFESDLILGQDLDFTDPDNDGKSIGLDKYTCEFIKQCQISECKMYGYMGSYKRLCRVEEHLVGEESDPICNKLYSVWTLDICRAVDIIGRCCFIA